MTMTLDGTNGVTFFDTSLQGAAASPYGLKNRIINGAMVVDQRNAGASVSGNAVYTLDRWLANASQNNKYTVQQNAAAVTPPVGYSKYLGVTSSSAYTVGAAEQFSLLQAIEGQNIADLAWGTANAKTVTLSFWVYSSLTGTFGGVLANSAFNRSYPFTYTISVANTWEQKTVTVAGDTSGTWLTTNGIGIYVGFNLGSGSTYSGTAGAWAAAQYFAPTGATSVVGTNGATFYITGVQLELGSTATPFERRMYTQELANCQRYFYKTTIDSGGSNSNYIMGVASSATQANYLSSTFPVTMRSSPTGAISGIRLYDGVAVYAITGIAQNSSSTTTAGLSFNVASGLTIARAYMAIPSGAATDNINFSAEL